MKISIKDVTKKFHDQVAVNQFSIDIESGELIALLGPSGCGKSTLLNMLSGILEASEGQILFGEDDVTHVSADKRGVGLVFQNYALYPHMSVLENICFPLEIQKVNKKERIERAKEVAKLVHVDQYLTRKPYQLSGGQQQRVAIARALIKNPKVLLLDEPLSNLDARLRIEMREEIRRIQLETKVTTIFVTHDQEEAMSISDRIIIMKDGVLQQCDKPQVLYDQPANCFVADFLGAPPINKLRGVSRDGKFYVDGEHVVETVAIDQSGQLWLSFRSEACYLDATEGIPCSVEQVSILGKETIVSVRVNDTLVRVSMQADALVDVSQAKYLKLKSQGCFIFDAQSGERYR
ncbi:MAG: ABC transporter ATP-binding protein [Erysipelotrichaceae bacterium]